VSYVVLAAVAQNGLAPRAAAPRATKDLVLTAVSQNGDLSTPRTSSRPTRKW